MAEQRSSLLGKEYGMQAAPSPRAGVTSFGAGTAINGSGTPGSGTVAPKYQTSPVKFPGEMERLLSNYNPQFINYDAGIGSTKQANPFYQLTDPETGELLYYMNDPEQFFVGKRGSKKFYDVPNLYLAYKQGVPNAEQYVIPVREFVADLKKRGLVAEELSLKPKMIRGYGAGSRGGLVPDPSGATEDPYAKGYIFKADPFQYGKYQYKQKGHSFGSVKNLQALAPLFPILAAPAAGIFGLGAKGMAAYGAAAGALSSPEDPLRGAVLGGGGALLPSGLGKAGITNPVAQQALTGATLSELKGQNALVGAGRGALAGFGQQAQEAERLQQLEQNLGGNEMPMGDYSFMDNVDFGGGGGLNTQSFGNDMFGGAYNQDFGGYSPDFGTSDFMGGELSQGLWSGGGMGLDPMSGGMGLDFSGGQGLQGPGGFPDFNIDQFGGGSGQPSMFERGKQGIQDFGKFIGSPGGKGAMNVLDKIIGAYGTNKAAGQYRNIANQSAQRADPFASQRGGYQSRLAQLYAQPGSVYEDPAYQAQEKQALDATGRAMSARGYNMSGNEMEALAQTGRATAGDWRRNEIDRLMQLSGAYANPGAAGAMYGQMAGQGVPMDLSTILQLSRLLNNPTMA